MASLRCTPLSFVVTGFAWLLLSALVGIATLLGLVKGTPLPHWLRSIHVHGALVGGVLQLVIGGLLLSASRNAELKETYLESHTGLFLTFNGATVALLLAFSLGHMMLAGSAGIVIIGVMLSFSRTAWSPLQKNMNQPAGSGSIYRAALISIIMGLTVGIAIAFRLVETYYAHARLLHIHLIVLGVTVAFVVVLHQIIPALLHSSLANVSLARLTLWSLPIGFAILLASFLTSFLWLEIAVGGLLAIGAGLCTYNLIATWVRSGMPGNAASDHLLLGMFFLLLTAITGVAMAANYLPTPPFLPMGGLHLVAYTHLTFIGFIVQSIFGVLSYSMPMLLAVTREPNTKKREAYRVQLDAIMNRWRAAQLASMSFGTMGLSVLAALTWSVPLGSFYVQIAVWITAALLVLSLALFSAKLAWAIGLQPSEHLPMPG